MHAFTSPATESLATMSPMVTFSDAAWRDIMTMMMMMMMMMMMLMMMMVMVMIGDD